MPHKNLEECNNCGICNLHCPSFLVIRKETASPRHRVNLAKKNKYDSSFYLCGPECGCLKSCPAGVELDLLAARAELVKLGIETEANQRMKSSIIKNGHPFGDVSKNKNINHYYT